MKEVGGIITENVPQTQKLASQIAPAASSYQRPRS
jgi:hypothetical protein